MRKLLYVFGMGSFLLFGCAGKENGEDVRVYSHFLFKAGSANFHPENIYVVNARNVQIDTLNIYVSHIGYKLPLGNAYQYDSNGIFLITLEDTTYSFVASGDRLDRISFDAGLPAAYNTNAGSKYQNPSQLNPQNPLSDANGMFVSPASGYYFFKMAGKIDLDGNQLFEPGETFSICIGGSSALRTIDRDVNIFLNESEIHLVNEIQVLELFTSTNLPVTPNLEVMQPTDPGYALSEVYLNNLLGAFGSYYLQ